MRLSQDCHKPLNILVTRRHPAGRKSLEFGFGIQLDIREIRIAKESQLNGNIQVNRAWHTADCSPYSRSQHVWNPLYVRNPGSPLCYGFEKTLLIIDSLLGVPVKT